MQKSYKNLNHANNTFKNEKKKNSGYRYNPNKDNES